MPKAEKTFKSVSPNPVALHVGIQVERPALAKALWWMTLVDSSTLREWVVNIGRRQAEERIAHLFCELHLRLKSVGLAEENDYRLPITQAELGDTVGITDVHANRALQELRAKKLITWTAQKLEILDLGSLRDMCGFDSNYLHL